MEKPKNISQYRSRLDKTLASRELTNVETLKELVRVQILRTLECELEENFENVVEKRTKEVFNLLEMLKGTSEYDDALQSRDTHQKGWKLKQDAEEYRVMYRQGPEGTPFHTLLVEGYVDGPIDVCLCISWESTLYRKWWPQTSIPTFKILSSECLQRVRIGEQICLVRKANTIQKQAKSSLISVILEYSSNYLEERAKLSWPLSSREAVVHYFEFEYFQDDLIVVIFNSISDLETIDRSRYGFSKEGLPDVQDVVRIDMVGGLVMQKVTADRSYFRTISNVDLKLDFVPPSVINFISRQLIGSGFRLYQKEVASVCRGDEDFRKALEDPLYSRIREALYSDNEQKKILESDGGKETLPEDTLVVDHKTITEIEEIDEEDVGHRSRDLEEDGKKIHYLTANNKYMDEDKSYNINKREVGISPQVKQALETLEKAIAIFRGYNNSDPHVPRASLYLQKRALEELKSSEDGKDCSKSRVSADVSKDESVERTSHEQRNSCSSCSSRRTGSNSYLREANHSNKIVPALPEENPVYPCETQHIPVHDDESCNKMGGKASSIITDKNNAVDEEQQQLASATPPMNGITKSRGKHRKLRRYNCCSLR